MGNRGLRNELLITPWCCGDSKKLGEISKTQDEAKLWGKQNDSVLNGCVVIGEKTRMEEGGCDASDLKGCMLKVQRDLNSSGMRAGRCVVSGFAGRQMGGYTKGLGWSTDVSRVRS